MNFTIDEIKEKKASVKSIIDKDEAKKAKIEAIAKELEAVEYLESYEVNQKDSIIKAGQLLASNNNKRNGDDKIATKGFQAYKADLLEQSREVIKAEELGVLDSVLKLYHTPKK
jgi:hypothetical protein